jgi:hypothetical protein
MISRSTKDGKQLLVGLKKTEIDMLLAKDKRARVRHNDMEISIFVVDGDDKAVEEEFLRIIALNNNPTKGAKRK